MKTSQIIELLPYQKPFLFVDGIDEVSDKDIQGHYTFKEDESFYEGHFKDSPLTPGVILTECMAQIGLVCLGIFILKDRLQEHQKPQIAFTSYQMDFYLPVFPGQKVTVQSEKEVFRFNKLRCKVKMKTEEGELIARGKMSGMIKL